jgi:HK97 family phage portal protein
MGVLGRYWASGNPSDERYWPSSQVLQTEAGEQVTTRSALGVSTIYRAVSVLAAATALLPLDAFDPLPDGEGKRVSTDGAARRLLRRRPNRAQTHYRWIHHMVGHVLLGGNYYAQKVRRPGGPVEGLFPLNPATIKPKEIQPDGSLVYELTRKDGTQTRLGSDSILHVRGFSEDGFSGVSVLELMREHVGQSLASVRQRSNFLRNELRPSAVIKHPSALGPAAEKHLQEGYQNAHGGPGKAGGAFVIGEGADIVPWTVTSRDAQWVEGEGIRTEDFLRFIGVPGVLCGYADKTATYASAESFFQSFVTHSLWPVSGNVEDELTVCLFDDEGDPERFCEFNLDAMLRADSAARAAFYRTMIELGVFSPNEVRGLENRNSYEGGDTRYIPANLAPAGQPRPAAVQAPAPAPQGGPQDAQAAEAWGAVTSIVRATAADVVRREVLHLVGAPGQKGLAVRYAGDASGFARQVRDFYAHHAETVRRRLPSLPAEVAARWCDEQAAAVMSGGVGVTERWETERVPVLERLALTGGMAC